MLGVLITKKEEQETFGGDMSITLIVVMVSQVNAYV